MMPLCDSPGDPDVALGRLFGASKGLMGLLAKRAVEHLLQYLKSELPKDSVHTHMFGIILI